MHLKSLAKVQSINERNNGNYLFHYTLKASVCISTAESEIKYQQDRLCLLILSEDPELSLKAVFIMIQ